MPMVKKQQKNSVGQKKCRSCGFEQLDDILSLGNLYVSNFVDSVLVVKREKLYPLELVLCDASKGGCGLLQLRHTVSPKKMYRNYWYRSGVNKTMIDELAGIANVTEKIVGLKRGDLVVDIGANDGTLLRAYKSPDIKLVGFEPAKNLIPFAIERTSKIFNNFFERRHLTKEFGNQKAKIITAIAMFYDLDNPNSFVADIKKSLRDDGLFIIQMSYLPSMLKQTAFDNICHEHIEYYSLLSLEQLLARHGLEVFDVELNDINGGSFRTYIRHIGSKIGESRYGRKKRREKILALERQMGLNSQKPYNKFVSKIKEIKNKLCDFIKSETAKGKKVYVYGASTKGNTLLQYFGLDNSLITAAAERNPIKWGKQTIGTNIPIISEEQARAERPDYFLVLPWHFMSEFLQREKRYLQSGGKFIVPLPKFKVIGAKNL